MSENADAWINSIRDALTKEGATLTPDCAVLDSVGDMMFGTDSDYFIAIAGNHPDDAEDSPVRSVMVLHVGDLMKIATKVLTHLKTEGKLEYLQSLGVPVVDMSGDEDSPERKLH